MAKPSKPTPGRATQGGATGDNSPTEETNNVSAEEKGNTTSSAADALIEEAEAVLEGEPLEPVSEGTCDEQVIRAKAEAAEWQDKYLRLHAEWDTYRRRTTEQREIEKARAAEKLVMSLLPVIDDFERTIDYATKNGEQGLLEGVGAVRSKFVDVLVKDGVVVIDPKGEAFDALEAQAVATVDDASVPDETVAEVYQKGYKMGMKVLRPAMVTVTSGGPKREKAPDESGQNKK